MKTAREKYKAIIDEIENLRKAGRPTLVGTTSVEVSELLSRMLKMKKLPHQVLNAKLHQKEAEVVIEAGKAGTVTIAKYGQQNYHSVRNMAGYVCYINQICETHTARKLPTVALSYRFSIKVILIMQLGSCALLASTCRAQDQWRSIFPPNWRFLQCCRAP